MSTGRESDQRIVWLQIKHIFQFLGLNLNSFFSSFHFVCVCVQEHHVSMLLISTQMSLGLQRVYHCKEIVLLKVFSSGDFSCFIQFILLDCFHYLPIIL